VRDVIEFRLRTDKMERAVNVGEVLSGRKAEGRRRSLELIEWTERRFARAWRPIVVAVDHETIRVEGICLLICFTERKLRVSLRGIVWRAHA
jgi:hypothetical protein